MNFGLILLFITTFRLIKGGYTNINYGFRPHKNIVSYGTHHPPSYQRLNIGYAVPYSAINHHQSHQYFNTPISKFNHFSDYNIGNIGYNVGGDQHEETDYKFKYGVEDIHTGDKKQQFEVRENGVVRGQYSLVEPDGSIRIVEYTADPIHGFSAVVHKTGHESVAFGHH